VPLGPLKTRLGLRRAFAAARGSAVWAILFVCLLALNLGQLASLVVLPFSRKAFRRFNRWAANTWWGACVLTARHLNGTRFVVTGDDLPHGENAIVVANHQQMPDITTIMDLALVKGRLGDLKWFVKDALKWAPGIGWGMRFLSCPFVKRNWTADRASVEHTFHALVAERQPMWLVIFAEGTRLTPAKLLRSRAYALREGLYAAEHVLLPRTKGFAAAVGVLRDHVSAVYDLTIGYVEGVPTLGQYITGAVRRVHLHARRFAIDTLPREEDALALWLRQRFEEKDRLLATYYASGSFVTE
jgi:1-acyl-sn-glycerol-3-phosphate acyltransferase